MNGGSGRRKRSARRGSVRSRAAMRRRRRSPARIQRMTAGNVWMPGNTTHGSKGIVQWLINWCTSPMMKHKLPLLYITISGWNVWTPNLMKQPIRIWMKSLKLLSESIRKRHNKTLGTSVINSPMSPPCQDYFATVHESALNHNHTNATNNFPFSQN